MQHTPYWLVLLVAVIMLGKQCPGVEEKAPWDRDPDMSTWFYARGVPIPIQTNEVKFLPADRRALFTLFHGADNVEVKDGKLCFTMTADQATLGWGNYLGALPASQTPFGKEITRHPTGGFFLRLRQTEGPTSIWSAKTWVDGKAGLIRTEDQAKYKPAVANGNEWQEIMLPTRSYCFLVPDGLEITVQAAKGARFEIEWLKAVWVVNEGYTRKEITVPKGRIWKALADIGGGNGYQGGKEGIRAEWFLNGQKIDCGNFAFYTTKIVDLKPYLKEGTNCFAFSGHQEGYSPFNCLQAAVIMESGEIIRAYSDNTWKVSPKEVPNWTQPGFDDSAWKPGADIKPEPAGTYAVWHFMQNMPPAHKGYLEIRHAAGRRDFFFPDSSNMQVQVLIPRGLAAQAPLATRSPVVEYRLGKADDQGGSAPIAENRVATFTEDPASGSLVFALDLGKREAGVYSLALRLLDGSGKELDARPREALVVLASAPDKTITGKDYREGLDLELEQVIDFTDPKDPHPSVEGRFVRTKPVEKVAAPTIIKKEGLTYRETAEGEGGNYISYRLGEFKHPGDFYLMELEYPDDADRVALVSISRQRTNSWCNSETGVGYETGGKYYKTGAMQTLSWMHVADSGVHAVDISTYNRGYAANRPAAVKALKIHHVRGRLPSVGGGQERQYGIHTERVYFNSGIGNNFGSYYPPRTTRDFYRDPVPLLRDYFTDLVWLWKTSDRYAQYLKFSGQNTLLMGCWQYSEGNTEYVAADRIPGRRVTRCMKTVLAHTLDAYGIDILAGIEYAQSMNLRSFVNNAQVAQGADTVWMVDEKGEQLYAILESYLSPNYLHPRYKRLYADLLEGLMNTFGDLPHFKGISNFLAPMQGYFGQPAYLAESPDYLNPLAYSFDDITFALFEKETQTDLHMESGDIKRFEKRAALMKTSPELRAKFLAWRCRQLNDFLGEVGAQVVGRRSDLQFVNILPLDMPYYKPMLEHRLTFDGMMKSYGIDIQAIGGLAHQMVAPIVVSWSASATQDPYGWIPRESPAVWNTFRAQPRRGVLCRTSWCETGVVAPGYTWGKTGSVWVDNSDWMLSHYQIRTEPQAAGYNAREALIQAIITLDPQLALAGFTDMAVNLGHEQELREVMRVFTCLPAGDFKPALDTGLDSNLAIRTLSQGGKSWLYIANPGYWAIEGTVALKAGGNLTSLPDGQKAAGKGEIKLPVKLAPFGLCAYVCQGPLQVTSYETGSITERELAHMTRILDRVTTLLNDKGVRLVLAPEDRAYMEDILKRSRAALGARQYALAWSLVKDCRFWSYWTDFLEKASRFMALLPPTLTVEPRANTDRDVPTLTAAKTTAPIRLDGKLDEADWTKGAFSSGFTADGKPALNQSAVKALYDDQALYVAVVCADKDIQALKTTAGPEDNESAVWNSGDDAVGVFLQPDESKPLYYQMAFNAKGVRFDQEVKGSERNYVFHPEWNVACGKTNGYWTAEVMFPYRAFGLEGKGTNTWRINIGRRMRDDVLNRSEWNHCPVSWHETDRYGRLQFVN